MLLDGGMGTFLLKYLSGLQPTDTLNHTHPQAVISAHTAFLMAGSRYLTTNTFCSDTLSLKSSGYGIKTTSQRGAELAVSARDAFYKAQSTAPSLITVPPITLMGSLGPGWRSPEKGEVSAKTLIDEYALRAEGLMAGGVDGFVIETVQDLQQAEAALLGIKKAMATDAAMPMPVFITASVSEQGQRIGQHHLKTALHALQDLQPTGLGFNCGEGPEHLEKALAALQGFQGAILLKPNAGKPQNPLTPSVFAQTLNAYLHTQKTPQITHWGGCCGASPAHIQALDALPLILSCE